MFLSMAKRQDPIVRMTAAIRILGFMAGLLSQLYQRNGKLGIGGMRRVGDGETGRVGDGRSIFDHRSSIISESPVPLAQSPPRPLAHSPPLPPATDSQH